MTAVHAGVGLSGAADARSLVVRSGGAFLLPELHLMRAGVTSLHVRWGVTAPAALGTAGADAASTPHLPAFMLEVQAEDGSFETVAVGTHREGVVSGLHSNTSYRLRVAVLNADGSPGAFAYAALCTLPRTPRAVRIGGVALGGAICTAEVQWEPPADARAPAPRRYLLEWRAADRRAAARAACARGHVPGGREVVGAWLDDLLSDTEPSLQAPEPRAARRGAGPSMVDGSSAGAGADTDARAGSVGGWRWLHWTSQLRYTAGWLPHNHTISFRVTAFNAQGEPGEPSAARSVTTPLPGPPTPEVCMVTQSTVVLQWGVAARARVYRQRWRALCARWDRAARVIQRAFRAASLRRRLRWLSITSREARAALVLQRWVRGELARRRVARLVAVEAAGEWVQHRTPDGLLYFVHSASGRRQWWEPVHLPRWHPSPPRIRRFARTHDGAWEERWCAAPHALRALCAEAAARCAQGPGMAALLPA